MKEAEREMRFEIPEIGVLEVKTNYDYGCPAFHIYYNGETLVHAEMHLEKKGVEVFVWPKECFKDEESMSKYLAYEYPGGFKGIED